MEFLINELLNKEVTLSDLDNLVQKELKTKDSLFCNLKLAIENNSWAYNNKINIIWELVDFSNLDEIIVKVIEIEEL